MLKRRILKLAVSVVTIASALGLSSLGALAFGATTVAAASAATTGVQPQFAAQAHAVGVSVAQADHLQQEVSSYIHEHGGTQAALNVVDFAGGSITFTVPGERYARDLATDPHPLAAPACGPTAFCEYNGTFYGGNQEISIFDNCKYQDMPFTGEGSYINHLPYSGFADWYDVTKTRVLYVTPRSPAANPEVNWLPVYYTIACY